MNTKTYKRAIRRLGMALVTLVLLVLLTACPEPSRTDWQGPVGLNAHLAYFDSETGRVAMFDPRKEGGDPLVVELPGPEDPDELREGFAQILTFPDNTHMIFAAQDTNAFHIVSDAERRVVMTIADVPPIINAAAFSADGRWLIFYVAKGGDENMQEARLPSPSGDNLRLGHYIFPNSSSVLLNEHRLIVVDRETMESFTVDLPRNDIPIQRLRFSGAFRICDSGTLCKDSDARQMELVVAAGQGRVWMFDPGDGAGAKVSVVPISESDARSAVSVLTLRASSNLAEPAGGTDNRETLFMTTSGARDILAVNMMWSKETGGLSVTLNKLPLDFQAQDIELYLDRDGLYLMALGSGNLASVHTESARTSRFSVFAGANTIRPLARNGQVAHMLLVGGDSLGLVKLQDFNVFGSKNITTAKVGFHAHVTDVGDEGPWRALCLDRDFSRLAAIDLDELTARNLSATVQRLGQDVQSVLPVADEGKLYLSGVCRVDRYSKHDDSPLLCDVYALELFEAEPKISQITLEDIDPAFLVLPAAGDEPMALVYQDARYQDRLVVVAGDSLESRELVDFLRAID